MHLVNDPPSPAPSRAVRPAGNHPVVRELEILTPRPLGCPGPLPEPFARYLIILRKSRLVE